MPCGLQAVGSLGEQVDYPDENNDVDQSFGGQVDHLDENHDQDL